MHFRRESLANAARLIGRRMTSSRLEVCGVQRASQQQLHYFKVAATKSAVVRIASAILASESCAALFPTFVAKP